MKQARMADVGKKAITERKAIAMGRISMGHATFEKLRSGGLHKGDPLALAQYAGINAAKRTSEWILLCHPLPLDHVEVRCELEPQSSSVRVEVHALATAKTGVEMEALTGATAALLALYDVLKADDPALTISDVRLLHKRGGKSGEYNHASFSPEMNTQQATEKSLAGLKIALLTVSDRVGRNEAEDKSQPALEQAVLARGGEVVSRAVVTDDVDKIVAAFKEAANKADIVLSTGGTGLSPRDVTPEALAIVCTRLLANLGEAFRSKTAAFTDKAWLSRAGAGLIGETLVFAFPGSPRAVTQGMQAVGDLLAHALHTARGGAHS